MQITQAEASALAQIIPDLSATYVPDPGKPQGQLVYPDGTDPAVIAGAQATLSAFRAGTISVPIPVPESLTKLGLKRAFTELGLWPAVKQFIASDPDFQDEWDLATELKLSDPIMQKAIAAFAARGIPVDPVKLAIRANQLVA